MYAKIFINYRRGDAPTSTERIYERLSREVGSASLFRDIHDIPPGADFARVLEAAIEDSRVMLSIIGPNWLGQRALFGRRRIDDRDDFVRFEIATALRQRLHVIPLLVDGAQMPSEGQLPNEIRELSKRNALVVNQTAFDAHLAKLASTLKALLDANEETANAPARQGDREFLRGSRVLWVDDQPINNQYEQRALETLGIEIVRAHDTQDGLRKFDAERFHLVVSDMRRPSGHDAGYALLKEIRARSQHTPFVLYSATAQATRQDAWSRGAQVATDNVRELIAGVVGQLLSRRLGGSDPQPEMTRIVGRGASGAYDGDATRPATQRPPVGLDAPVAGWLVVIDGPGRGKSREIHAGSNTLGRGADQSVQLDFGDNTISRKQAVLTFDEAANRYVIAPCMGSQAPIYAGDNVVVGETVLTDREIIRVGSTSLLFVALCGDTFAWSTRR